MVEDGDGSRRYDRGHLGAHLGCDRGHLDRTSEIGDIYDLNVPGRAP